MYIFTLSVLDSNVHPQIWHTHTPISTLESGGLCQARPAENRFFLRMYMWCPDVAQASLVVCLGRLHVYPFYIYVFLFSGDCKQTEDVKKGGDHSLGCQSACPRGPWKRRKHLGINNYRNISTSSMQKQTISSLHDISPMPHMPTPKK